MKKILTGILALAMTVSAGITVFAEDKKADYDEADNKVTNVTDVANFSTVIISKAGEEINGESIVYLKQASDDNTFSNTVKFMLKADPKPGDYIITLGGYECDSEHIPFTIGGEITVEDKQMKALDVEQGDSGLNMGFAIEEVDLDAYKSIKVVIEPDEAEPIIGAYSTKVFGSISGTVNLALQINNVPDKYKDKISLYLSANNVDDHPAIKWADETEEGN